MVVQLSISLNQEEFLRGLGGRRDQLRFAMSLAINKVGKMAVKEATAGLKRYLDKPTPFTTGGKGAKPIFLAPSSKHRLVARVGVSDLQWKYLKYQVEGGVRHPARQHVVVPVAARLNTYGNMKRNSSGMVEQWNVAPKHGHGSTFFGTPKGRPGAKPGVYQRQERGKRKGTLKMLAAFRPFARYEKRYPFAMLVQNSVKANWPLAAHLAINQALKSAK